jgi:hypothetical protein
MVEPEREWYWDLERKIAVPASERGPGERMLGPYPSRAEAEQWRQRVEERNARWDDEDEAWAGDDGPAPDPPPRVP